MYTCNVVVIVFLYIGVIFIDFFFFKHKTAYEMRISDWSSDVCSSDLGTNILRFDDDATSITAVSSGQGDIFATAPPLLKAINKKKPGKDMETQIVLSTALLGIGVNNENNAHKGRVDKSMRANLKNGKQKDHYKKKQRSNLTKKNTQ